jgi:GTPase
MEIGDLFVINKADREGVYSTEKELEALLSLAQRSDDWQPAIVKTVATENKGIEDLADAIESCRTAQHDSKTVLNRRRAVARWRILELLREQLLLQALAQNNAAATLDTMADEVATRRRDPYSAVEEIIRSVR